MTCTHNSMIPNNSATHAWKCADCGYVYGETKTPMDLDENECNQCIDPNCGLYGCLRGTA